MGRTMTKTGKRLGLRATARHFKVDKKTITRMVERGVIMPGPDGLYDIDEVAEVRSNMDEERQKRGRETRAAEKKAKAEAEDQDEIEIEDSELEVPNAQNSNTAKMSKAKQHEAVYKAKLAQLKYQREAGEVVDRKDVEDTLFAIGKKMQTRMMGWTPRFMAHMTDTGKELVKEEISGLLDELQRDMRDAT